MDAKRSRIGYRLHEGFDLSGSDTDYTDTFADMDDAAETVREFAKGLIPARCGYRTAPGSGGSAGSSTRSPGRGTSSSAWTTRSGR